MVLRIKADVVEEEPEEIDHFADLGVAEEVASVEHASPLKLMDAPKHPKSPASFKSDDEVKVEASPLSRSSRKEYPESPLNRGMISREYTSNSLVPNSLAVLPQSSSMEEMWEPVYHGMLYIVCCFHLFFCCCCAFRCLYFSFLFFPFCNCLVFVCLPSCSCRDSDFGRVTMTILTLCVLS